VTWRVFTGGRIYTADARGSWAEALAVFGDRIAAVGPEASVRAVVPPGTPEVSLRGLTAGPGFVDAHSHFVQTSYSLTWVDARFPRVATVDALVAAIAERAASTPAGEWIRARGLDHDQFVDGRLPTRLDLDRATRDHPVLVRHVSGHHALVNSAALSRRVGHAVRDPEGGRFLRDARGRPNGWCLDAAMELVLPTVVDVGNHAPNIHFEAELDELAESLTVGSREYLAVGVTTVCDAQVSRRELTAYREGRHRQTLGIRVVCMPLSHQLDALAATGIAGPLGDDWLRLGPMKLYADGALTGGTAVFTEPYGTRGELSGTLFHEPAELNGLIANAVSNGWQVGVHAQGDRAIDLTLDAIESATHGQPGGRHRLEHAGYPAGSLARAARLGVVTVSQPGYLYDFGDTLLRILGSRAQHLLPLRAELDLGITVALSSDSTVSTFRALHHIASAVNRRTRSGQPIGTEQALTVEEAIRGYTIDAARSMFCEDRVGSLEVGKLADLAVFEEDPFRVSRDRLADVEIAMTVLGGEVVHERG
jgi:predicted amidohydrolase YtcJ